MPLTYLYPSMVAKRPDFEKMRENQTYGICMSLMGLAMDISKTDKEGKPNAKDWAELSRRVKIWEALHSPLFLATDGTSKTLDVFKNHWGVETNVSTLTAQQWDKKTREAYDREQSWYPKG